MEVVNGYPCKTCTDVANAKRGIDPAHPKDGPNGIYKLDKIEAAQAQRGPAVRLDGALADLSPTRAVQPAAYAPGALSDIRV